MKNGRVGRNGLETLVQTRRALVRATILFGSVAVAFALVVGPPERNHRMAAFNQGVDDMMTGSIGGGERYVVRRSVLQSPGSAPCLYFPDGTQRGDC